MAVPRLILHLALFLESAFLYWAVIRLKHTGEHCQHIQDMALEEKMEESGAGRGASLGAGGGVRPLYIVTPTYTRATQLADLTRLANTLRLVPGVHWLVSEDRNSTSLPVTQLLEASGLEYTQLAAARPPELIGKVIGRGVFNRRAALAWIREHGSNEGVIYFADDDNSYDVRIFEEIRQTRGISVFPVGLILKYGISSPIIREGRVVGFFDAFQAGRQYAMDMAGFSVSVRLLREKPKATFPAVVSYLEEGFVRSLGVPREELEPRAEMCSRVWVWHSRTEKAHLPKREHLQEGDWDDTNLPQLYSNLFAS